MEHEIEISEYGFVKVRVDIKPKNNTTMKHAYFKVDSGANRTTLNRRFLYQLGYDENWIKSGKLLENEARPTLASGVSIGDCYQVILPEIHIGNWVGYNWPVLTSPSIPFKFLLGTDSMQFFNWNFNYESGFCKFGLIPNKRKILFNNKEQSIHAVSAS